MVDRDVTDPSNFTGKLRGQIETVQQLDNREDAQAIVRWINGMAAATTTKIGRANCIKMIAERADQPLHEFADDGEVTELFDQFRTGEHPDVKDGGLSEGTLRQYRQAAKLFFRDELGREWAEDIVIGQAERPPVSREKIFTSDEVDTLLETATNPRDKALIAFLTVTGQRITAALSIVLDDVELNDRTAEIYLNEDAIGLKGASGPRPLLWARPYIANWLESHPKRRDPQAPLFCATQGGSRPQEDGSIISWEEGDVLSRTQAHNRLKAVAERAGMEPSRMKPHNFRHTAITRMRDQGIDDDRIKFMVGVKPRSNILERYDQADNRKMMQRLREQHGLAPEEDAPVGRPSLDECPQCQTTLRESVRFCPSCGTPMDTEAAEETENRGDRVKESLAELPPEKARKLLELSDLVDDPDIESALLD